MKIKVCGMRDAENIKELVKIGPEFIGFIFYEKSPRYVGEDFVMPRISESIKKVGVFVNETQEKVEKLIETHALDAVQLHGTESVEYCTALKKNNPDLMLLKAIGIAEKEDLEKVRDYEKVCHMLVLDTKGKNHGGNGKMWNHELLKGFDIRIPFLLSGGIDEYFTVQSTAEIHPACVGVDINSKFEDSPAMKNIQKLQKFIHGKQE